MFSSLVGIDIGSSSIKVVELGGFRGRRTLKALGLEMIPHGVIVDGCIQDDASVENIIRTLLDRLKIGTLGRGASISLSGSGVEVAKIEVDAAKGDVDEQICYEVEQRFQMDLGEIYFKYKVLDGSPSNLKTEVVLVAAKRELVEHYSSVMRNVGMRALVIDCDIFCLGNMFEYTFPLTGATMGIINIGASTTQIIVVHNNQFVFSREIRIGSEDYSQQIMQATGTDWENAEALKISVSSQSGQGTLEELQDIITALNKQLIDEIANGLALFYDNPENANNYRLQHMFLTGGGAKLFGFDSMLAGTLQLPVQVLNPFYRINVNPKQFDINYVLMQGHLFGVAVGLALRKAGDDEE